MAVFRSAFLCNTAMLHENGLWSVLGGGIRTWEAPEFPFVVPITIIAAFDWEPEEVNQDHMVVSTVEMNGVVVAREQLPGPAAPSHISELPSQLTLVLQHTFQAQQQGLYTVRLRVDGAELASLPLWVTSTLPPI